MSVATKRGPPPILGPERPRFLRLLGPGLITGASDDDPSGIATYSQAGGQFGFAISWTMLFSYPLMVAIQQISARIGRITGKGIAGNLRQHYPNWLLQVIVALLFTANTINIGADLGAMADALGLLVGGPVLIYVIAFGSFCAILQVFMAYRRYVAVLKWLTVALFAYFGTVIACTFRGARRCAACSFRRFSLTPRSGPRSSPSSAPRSAPTCFSGRRRRRPRTFASNPNASRS